MTLIPALVLWWGWRRGFFRDLDAQSRVIFETRDWQLERPWESTADRRTRERAHGPLRAPVPGEWGDGRGSNPAERSRLRFGGAPRR